MPKQQASSSSGGGGGGLSIRTILALVVAFFSTLFYILDGHLEKFYIFETPHLHDMSKRAIAAHGNDTTAVVKYIVDELRVKLPGYINTNEEWFFNNAGGAMGGMWVLHASVTEYLIIFGTAVGTEGHTGRHTADDYFHILSGTQTAYSLGSYEPEVYPQGSMHHLRRGTVKQYRMPEGCFALEYARGWIPPMLFFGFADGLSSTLDFPTMWSQTWISGREIVGNLLNLKL